MNTTSIFKRFPDIKQTIHLLICLFLLSGCENFIETDDPIGQISHQDIFEDEITATAAGTTMYAKLRDEVLVTGKSSGLGALMGLYTDELNQYGMPGQYLESFHEHQIISSNNTVSSMWNSSYNLVYMANALIEGLKTSTNLSLNTKSQLLGEALFIRAMVHFYLANLFGDVPYIKTTDYKVNRQVSRLQKDIVYEYIIIDLNQAKEMLDDNYITNERIRANKGTVSALLARVYLYMKQWKKAENESSLLINNSSLYKLSLNIDEDFLKTSTSAILQLKSKTETFRTNEGGTYIFTSTPPPILALNKNLIDDMENGDLRKANWIGEVSDGNNIWYYANKYKQSAGFQYSTLFRLAEQYLIRAEARTMQNNITGAQQDLNKIRQRAGLQSLTASTKTELLDAILKERRFELFTEHGHRWFDLRRFGIAEEILSPIKPGWQPTDLLLPIPESELLMNPNLNPQNLGY